MTFEIRMKKLIDNVNFERKEAFVYLKSGIVLFLKGNIEMKKGHLLVSDISEDIIIRYEDISAFKILHEVLPKEKEETEENSVENA